MTDENHRDVDFGDANADNNPDDAVRVEADDLRSREDIERDIEVRELRRTVDELKDMVHRQADRIDELEQKVDESGSESGHRSKVEKIVRLDEYDGISKYKERVARIWEELPKHANRTNDAAFDNVEIYYSLNYRALCDALAAVDEEQWSSGAKVRPQEVKYARDAFEEIAPCEILDGEGGSKKVTIAAKKWAVDRPKTVAQRLMANKDLERFEAQVRL